MRGWAPRLQLPLSGTAGKGASLRCGCAHARAGTERLAIVATDEWLRSECECALAFVMYCLSQASYTHRYRELLRCRFASIDEIDCIASTLKQGAEGAIDTRLGSAIRVRLVEGWDVLWRIHEECDRRLLCLSLRPNPLTPMFPSAHFLLRWTSFSRASS
jgi:hypothetical protein